MPFLQAIFSIPLMFYLSVILYGVCGYFYIRLAEDRKRNTPPPTLADSPQKEELDVAGEIILNSLFGASIGFGIMILFFTYDLVRDYRNSAGIFYPTSLISEESLPPDMEDVLPPAP